MYFSSRKSRGTPARAHSPATKPIRFQGRGWPRHGQVSQMSNGTMLPTHTRPDSRMFSVMAPSRPRSHAVRQRSTRRSRVSAQSMVRTSAVSGTWIQGVRP